MNRPNDAGSRDALIGLGVATLAVLTIAAAIVTARHAFLDERPRPKIAYFETLRRVSSGAAISIDRIDGFGTIATRSADGVLLSRQGAVQLQGWAIDTNHMIPLAAVYAEVDTDARRYVGTYGGQRPDVASALHCRCTASGFSLVVPAEALPPGRHRISLLLVLTDVAREVPKPVDVFVES